MAVILNQTKASINHSCIKELPGTLRYYPGLDDYKRNDIAHGTVARCSCGKLWEIRKDIINVKYWSPAGLINRWKYRNSGKEVDA